MRSNPSLPPGFVRAEWEPCVRLQPLRSQRKRERRLDLARVLLWTEQGLLSSTHLAGERRERSAAWLQAVGSDAALQGLQRQQGRRHDLAGVGLGVGCRVSVSWRGRADVTLGSWARDRWVGWQGGATGAWRRRQTGLVG